MKQRIYSLLLALLALHACNPLEVDPTDKIDAENAIKDANGIEAAINGIYDVFQSAAISQDAIIFADLATDNLIHVGTKKEYRQVSDRRIVAENAYVSGLWNACYDGINRANNFLAALPEVAGIPDADRAQYRGEALFLRAYLYSILAVYFQDVPWKTQATTSIDPAELNAAPLPQSEIFANIISDLEEAETAFADEGLGDPSFVNEYAIKALLARMYLYAEQWADASNKANEVLQARGMLATDDTNPFVTSDYEALYDESSVSDMILFQIDFAHDDDVNALADWFLPEGRFEVAAWETYDKENSIAELYTLADIRYYGAVGDNGTDYYGNKYQDVNTDNDNVIFLRMAELYLIKAEALNEVAYVADGEAFDMLNIVRQRAQVPELSAEDITDQDAFRLAVEQERRLELVFEGHRWVDLRRTGRINEVLGDEGTLPAAGWYLPYPQSEVDLNESLSQRTGY